MKNILRLEEVALFLLFTLMYFQYFEGAWGWYLGLFFAPDLAILLYLISPKAGAIAYNIAHHKGIMAVVIIAGLYFNHNMVLWVGIIFMCHSCFDRIFGYGLKYADAFGHTHLGWIGKSEETK